MGVIASAAGVRLLAVTFAITVPPGVAVTFSCAAFELAVVGVNWTVTVQWSPGPRGALHVVADTENWAASLPASAGDGTPVG